MPEAKYISKIQIVDGDSYSIKDKQARDDVKVYLPSETISIDNNNQISISDTYQQKTTNIESSIHTIEGDVSDLQTGVSNIGSSLSDVSGDVDNLEVAVEDLADRVEAIEDISEGPVWVVPDK